MSDCRIICLLSLFLKFLTTCFKFVVFYTNSSEAFSFLKQADKAFKMMFSRSSVDDLNLSSTTFRILKKLSPCFGASEIYLMYWDWDLFSAEIISTKIVMTPPFFRSTLLMLFRAKNSRNIKSFFNLLFMFSFWCKIEGFCLKFVLILLSKKRAIVEVWLNSLNSVAFNFEGDKSFSPFVCKWSF